MIHPTPFLDLAHSTASAVAIVIGVSVLYGSHKQKREVLIICMLMRMYVTAREKGRENEREPKKEWGGGRIEKEREGDLKFKLSSPSKAAGPEVLF